MKEKLRSAAKAYKDIPMPNGYKGMIEGMISEATLNKRKNRIHWGKQVSIAASILFGVFVTTLNVNAQFATAVSKVPIIGEVAQLFHFSHKEEITDTYELQANIPQINLMEDTMYTQKVNQAIENEINQLMIDAKERSKVYKEAFLATGGKEEDFLPLQMSVDYSVKYSGNGIVSFGIDHFESFAAAYNDKYFYNLDLVNNKAITLEEIFGSEYEEMINKEVKKQMKERTENEGAVYFEGFKGIGENQDFYINPYGKIVIVFEKYEVAPGSMGIQEFVMKDLPMKVHYPLK